MFTFNYDKSYNIASLLFKNDILEIECCPESFTELSDYGYDSAPSNGEFNFYYNEEEITFTAAKHGDGEGGTLTLVFKMTKDIRNSLDKALKEWKDVILKSEEDEE